MASFQSDFMRIISERGFMHQCTDEKTLDRCAQKESVTAYIGFDCTAPSLHVGSLMQIMILRWLQKCGHKPIILMGGGTTKIGDPSGKDESRKLLAEEKIQENMDGIKEVFSKFIKFGKGENDAIMVNNDDWLKNINYIDFLREYGPHFSINRMLAFDSVKLRLDREHHLSFLEFNYMILQAYDFVELYDKYNCRLQIGGSDQWGNIINGIELKRRLNGAETKDNKELFGLTTPLITTSAGTKMGKSSDGAIWLNGNMFSPYDYWQFWRNTEDADVGRFLKLFTELPMDEIAGLEALEGAEINQAKIILANEATKLCHGEKAAKSAEETAKKTFEEGGAGENLPTAEIALSEFKAGIKIYELFVKSGLAASNGEARRLIKGGGAKIDGVKVEDENQLVQTPKNNAIKLSAGKKRHALIKAI